MKDLVGGFMESRDHHFSKKEKWDILIKEIFLRYKNNYLKNHFLNRMKTNFKGDENSF